jgi:hypothetical protein
MVNLNKRDSEILMGASAPVFYLGREINRRDEERSRKSIGVEDHPFLPINRDARDATKSAVEIGYG